jgi:hypothetical protein
MKRFLTLALVGALVLGVSSVVYANVCAFDAAPAATLLFPFVTYNYDLGFDGYNTLFAITNVSSEATIAHVTVWTDFSVAILDFNILLTGYDVQTLSIRDILKDGKLPVTTIAGHTTQEGINDDGPISESNSILPWDFTQPLDEPEATSVLSADARCTTGDSAYPGRYATPIPPQILELFKGWLQSSQTATWKHSDLCSFGSSYTPIPSPWMYNRTTASDTWMYITVDVVETCNKTFPDEAGYWVPAVGGGEARYDNILIGDVIWVNSTDRLSEASTAVHIEADTELGLVATEGVDGFPVSFYHRYSVMGPDNVSDYREPLPTAWAFRYFGARTEGLDTIIRAWKGSSIDAIVPDLKISPVSEAPTAMTATNVLAYTYYAWDEEENVLTTTQVPWSQPGGQSVVPNLLPLETQEVNVEQFNTVADSGWMLFVWPASNFYTESPLDATGCEDLYDLYQTWMGVKFTATGQYSAFTEGTVMANFNCFSQQMVQNGLGIAFDYVDLGGYVISDGVAVAAR